MEHITFVIGHGQHYINAKILTITWNQSHES